MDNRTIGTCSICGGPVTVPFAWYSVVPPVPSCKRCGAIMKQPEMPVIPMEPRQPLTMGYITGPDEEHWPLIFNPNRTRM